MKSYPNVGPEWVTSLYCGKYSRPNICLHNNIKNTITRLFSINRFFFHCEKTNHSLTVSLGPLKPPHSLSNMIKGTSSLFATNVHLWCMCVYVCVCAAGTRADITVRHLKGCSNKLGLTKSRHTRSSSKVLLAWDDGNVTRHSRLLRKVKDTASHEMRGWFMICFLTQSRDGSLRHDFIILVPVLT